MIAKVNDGMVDEVHGALCLAQAARKWLPPARTGNPAHPSVLTRWSERGIRAAGGRRVYLETWRVGGQRMTTKDAIEKFLGELNAGRRECDDIESEVFADRAHDACVALEKLGC